MNKKIEFLHKEVQEIIIKLQKRKNIEAIILFGSYAGKLFEIPSLTPDNISDVDLLVLTTNSYYYSEIKNFRGIEIETLYFPTKFISHLLIQKIPWVVHIFNDGFILYDKSKNAIKLKKLAHKIFLMGPPKIKKYTLYDKILYLRKIMHLINNKKYNKFLKRYFVYEAFNKSIDLFFITSKKWRPNSKNILKHIKYYSPNYFTLLKRFLEEDNIINQIKILNILYKKLALNWKDMNLNKSPKQFILCNRRKKEDD